MRGEAYGRELLNAADRQRGRHFSSGQQPSNISVRHQCSALRSGIAPPDCTAYSATGWSTFGSSCGSTCGSSASSHLTGCWTTRAAERPPASRSLRQTGAHRSRNALPPICTTADTLAPRTGYRRSEQASGQQVISNCPGRHYYSIGCFKPRSCETVDRMWHTAPDTERVTAGIVACSIPSVLERYVAPASNALGAVYIRRTPRVFACTDNDSARKLTSTLLAHSLQLTGARTDEFQNRLCLPHLVCEALEDSNGRRRATRLCSAHLVTEASMCSTTSISVWVTPLPSFSCWPRPQTSSRALTAKL